jgi:hypothetical protein
VDRIHYFSFLKISDLSLTSTSFGCLVWRWSFELSGFTQAREQSAHKCSDKVICLELRQVKVRLASLQVHSLVIFRKWAQVKLAGLQVYSLVIFRKWAQVKLASLQVHSSERGPFRFWLILGRRHLRLLEVPLILVLYCFLLPHSPFLPQCESKIHIIQNRIICVCKMGILFKKSWVNSKQFILIQLCGLELAVNT